MKTSAIQPHLLRREVQLGLILAVDGGVLSAWSAALGGWIAGAQAPPLLSPLLIIALLLGAAFVARLVTTRFASVPFGRVAAAILGLGLVFAIGLATLWSEAGTHNWAGDWVLFRQTGLGLRDSALMGLALVAWWRGLVAGRTKITLDDVEAGLRWAILSLACVLLINITMPSSQQVESTLVAATLVVLGAGLTGLPLARIHDMNERPRYQGGSPLGMRGPWLAIFLGMVLTLLLVTVLLAEVLTFHRIDDLTRPLAGPADLLFWLVIYAIALPMGLIAEVLIYLFRLLFYRNSSSQQPLQMPNINWAQAMRAQGSGGSGAPEALVIAVQAAKWTIGAVLLVIVLWLLVRAVFRFADWRSGDDVEESRDFVGSWSLLPAAIRRWLRLLMGWRPPPVIQVLHRNPVFDEGNIRAWGPRELYRELLRLGALHGRTRTPNETPHEYEQALERVQPFDAGRSDTALLTDVYEQARYGNEPPNETKVAQARVAIEHLRTPDEADRRGDRAAR